MLRQMIKTLVAAGLVLGMGSGLHAAGKGNGGGHSSSHGKGSNHASPAGHAKAQPGHGQPGHARSNPGKRVNRSEPVKRSAGSFRRNDSGKRGHAPHRVKGVQANWRRYWHPTYQRYFYADPEYGCSYFWDEEEGCYALLAEDDG